MNQKRPNSERVYRDLTPDERERIDRARAETENARETILTEGRARKAALEAARREIARTVAALKAERQRHGLSLADVEARCGLKRSALSRLENDPQANPTLLTLQRYAFALKMTLSTSLEPKSP